MNLIESTLFLAFCVIYCACDSSIYPYDLTTEYLKNPLAVDGRHPRLSWKLDGVEKVDGRTANNLWQTAYQIIAASSSSLLQGEPDLWDSGKVNSDLQINIPYAGKIPDAGRRIYWTVRVWDQLDQVSSYANQSSWDVGHSPEWTALWISAPNDLQKRPIAGLSNEDKEVISSHPGLKPVVYLRKEFTIDSEVKEAKIYATAEGLYKISVNADLDVPLLSPGWTDYHQTIQYQVYDVTKKLSSNNVIAVELGTGWYSGYVGFNKKFGHYGNKEAFLMELHIEFVNGSRVTLGTDETWKAATGPIMYSDLLQGELYYENHVLTGWKNHGYNDITWTRVETSDVYYENVHLVADRGQPVVELGRHHPLSVNEIRPGVWIYDFGLNFAGYVELELEYVFSNIRIQVRHGEVLNPDGSLYTENLGSARAIDTYVLNDSSKRKLSTILKPHFTYHGFRYVEVTGAPKELKEITGIQIGLEGITNSVSTDNRMVNELLTVIRNSQLSNFISVPTNCPQRDDRLGWMAEVQTFTPTAIYNGNIAAFMSKWMRDVMDAQSKTTGSFSDVSPRLVDESDGSPSYGDAGIIVTWHLYKMYGDERIIEENFEKMQMHLEKIWSANPNLLWLNGLNNNYGDLYSTESTPSGVFSTAFFAYDALLLSKMAKVIGKEADVNKYKKLHADISDAFIKAYVSTNDGGIEGNSQTAYLLPIAFEILPLELRLKTLRKLVDNIKKNDWHLTTGFGGVGYLLPVLSDYGYDDVAYKILLQTTYPSWGYMIENNATTLWESWKNYAEQSGSKHPIAASYNHYVFGAVGNWIYKYMGGLDTDETEVGFKKIIIKPHIGEGIGHSVVWYHSPYGSIAVEWVKMERSLDLFVRVPVNAKAQIVFTGSGQTYVRYVDSGEYSFSIPY